MDHDERFHQRWEFRRKEDESSDSSKSSLSGANEPSDKNLNLVEQALVLPRNEASDPLKWDASKPAKAPKRKTKMKSTNVTTCNKRKRHLAGNKESCSKRKNIDSSSDAAMLEDLKTFAGSLIQELSVAREELSERMREVARTVVASYPVLGCNNKKGRCNKKKGQPQKGNELKGQKSARGPSKSSKQGNELDAKGTTQTNKPDASCKTSQVSILKSNAASDGSKLCPVEMQRGESTMPSMRAHVTDSSRVVSTPFLTLPKSQLQNPSNGILVTSLSSGMENGKLMDDGKSSLSGFPEGFKPDDQFRTFPCFSRRMLPGLSIQSCSQTASIGIGFPVPLCHQGVGIGLNGPGSSFGVDPRRNSSRLSGFVVGNKMQERRDREIFVSKDVMKDGQTSTWLL